MSPHGAARAARQGKAFVDERGAIDRVDQRAHRARRDGVDRYVVRSLGDPTCTIADAEVVSPESCGLGRVERHPPG
ncbi:hypothetical protein [Nonomuraea lactucae]|uniref:hypothetical protein n=1 Tax=Nonomuraea lactucae TaxID=2249762 RepID=UPI000DE31402|nr:hypothetical protein [Nonomuraea lactucae]